MAGISQAWRYKFGCVGQRTEQVKTGQVNPDRPLVGPSVDTFVGCFVGSPWRAENREISSRGGSRGRTRGATRGPTRGSRFAFACSVRRLCVWSASFRPTQTGQCKIKWVWSSLRVGNHFGDSNSPRRRVTMLCFPGENDSESVRIVNTTAIAKHYDIRRCAWTI